MLRPLIRDVGYCAGAACVPPVMAWAMSSGPVRWGRLLSIFEVSFIFSLMIAIPMEQGLHYLMPRIHHLSRWVMIPIVGLTLAFFAVAGTLVGGVVICGLGLVPWDGYRSLVSGAVRMSLLLTFLFGIGGLVTNYLQHRLDEANALLRKKEEDERRAQALATEARLQSLESRVHPHFLFNAINSILSLMREDPRRAEHLLERMAALLRFSLDQQQRLVPLSQELRIVRDYLEIEQARFGDRLRYAIDVPEGLEGDIPPLAVQTLVENAVKFAVSPRREGGEIRVGAAASGSGLTIEVRDDGPGFSETEICPGHGLDLLRQRLAGLGTLELRREPGAMAARILLPAAVRA